LSETPRRRSWPGGVALVALFGYAAAIHRGLGPPDAGDGGWYTPTGFLLETGALAGLLASPVWSLLATALPAVGLVVTVFVFAHSALARALALSALAATLLFTFYGVQAAFVWRFFRWRGSVVMIATALCVGFSAAAPFLARSWLRFRWPLRLALFLPFFLGALALVRNATGTDPSLPFAISPWPAIPVFGIEVGALFAAVLFGGAALGTLGAARARTAAVGSRLGGIALLLLGAATPALLLAAGSRLGLLPFGVRAGTLVAVTLVALLGIALAGAVRVRGRPEKLLERARVLGVAAALVGVPLASAQALAHRDYSLTREVLAQEIIDALAAHYENEGMYPDSLDELVQSGRLEAIPEPAIGFDLLYDGEFLYTSFGTSYQLEFVAPRWVQCAYNPPWVDDEEEEDGDEDGEGSLAEAWSCPSQPPELW